MKTRLGVIAAIGFLLLQTATAATLFHRYTFETNANDVAGNAHGVVMGGAVFDGAGALIFDGNNDYVQLPSGIISSLDEVSVEAWVTWQAGAAPYWQRIFDFGSQAQGQGKSYLFLTPATGGGLNALPNWIRATISTNNVAGESPWLDWRSPLPTNTEAHVALTYSPSLGLTKLYLNGVALDAGAATVPLSQITDLNNWLGRSQFNFDPLFKGRFSELRIYRGFLLDTEVAASFLAGPSNPSVAEGTLICTAIAGDVSTNAATLNALVQPNGLAAALFFEYGRTTNYGMSTVVMEAGSEYSLTYMGSRVTNLTPGTIYHFRCVSTNAAGTNYGGNTSFITLPLITSFAMNTNGHFEVRFDASAESHYFLMQATNLPVGRGTSVTNAEITADGPFTLIDRTATNYPRRYYRLMVRDF
ncbi:MAG TPA: LamG domain-containing protein [Verrucomicrobiae bacterium]|nr:LamG domain-containing protein [Verrucomicrobiae bacterium]